MSAINCDIPISNVKIFEEILKNEGERGYLKILSVLQFERQCWEVLDTFPFLKIRAEEVSKYSKNKKQFFFLTHNFLTQNLHKDDVRSKMLNSMVGDGIDSGTKPESKIIPEGLVNPQAYSYIDFNGSLNLVSRPFIALGTNLIVIDADEISQHIRIGSLDKTIKPGHAVVVSNEFRFKPALDMYDYFSDFFADHRSNKLTEAETVEFSDALDVLFEGNLEIEKDLNIAHKRRKNYDPEFDHCPIRASRYGVLKYKENKVPYIEFNGPMLHFEKAQEELFLLHKSETLESKIRNGIYFVCALQSTVESLSLFYKMKAYDISKHDNDETSTTALIRSVNKLSQAVGRVFPESSEEFKLLERLRKFRNFFLHIGLNELEVNQETGLPKDFEPWLEYKFSKIQFDEAKRIFKYIFEVTGERHLFHVGNVKHYDIPSLND